MLETKRFWNYFLFTLQFSRNFCCVIILVCSLLFGWSNCIAISKIFQMNRLGLLHYVTCSLKSSENKSGTWIWKEYCEAVFGRETTIPKVTWRCEKWRMCNARSTTYCVLRKTDWFRRIIYLSIDYSMCK
jgi:hypothetical protein